MSQEATADFQGISLLLTQRRTVEARAELERLLALNPEDPEARSQAGDVYAYLGAHSAAYKQYNQAAETFNRLGRADRALAVHHKILELDAGMLDTATQARLKLLSLLVAAEDAIVADQPERAVAGYREAIRQFPNHTISYQRLASLLVRLNRGAEAAEQYLVVARAFHAHGVRGKARPYFERVLELQPAHAEALESLLDCLKSEANEEDAARFLRAAALAHLQAGSAEPAAAALRLLAAHPGEDTAVLDAAVALQRGELAQAEAAVERLGELGAEIRSLFQGLGRAALERGDGLPAEAFFRWAQGSARSRTPVAVARPSGTADPAGEPRSERPAPSPQDLPALRAVAEACLAEGLAEEACRILESLARVGPMDPEMKALWERAKAALRAGAEAVSAGRPEPPPPPPLKQVPAAPPAAGTGKNPVPPPLPDFAGPGKSASVPAPLPVLPPLPPPAFAAPPRAGAVPAPPVAPAGSAPAPVFSSPSRPPAPAPARRASPPVREPRPLIRGAAIQRTAYELELGELPPTWKAPLDDADELIE